MFDDEAFFSGWLGGELFGEEAFAQKRIPISQSFVQALVLRFDRKLREEIGEYIHDSYRELYFEPDCKEYTLLEFDTDNIFIWKARKKGNSDELERVGKKPDFIFPNCWVSWNLLDVFFVFSIRDFNGRPITTNISLLRRLIRKVKDNKIEYEIW